MPEAKAVPVDPTPRMEQVSFIALPATTLQMLADEGSRRNLTVPQLLAAALDEYLRNHPKE